MNRIFLIIVVVLVSALTLNQKCFCQLGTLSKSNPLRMEIDSSSIKDEIHKFKTLIEIKPRSLEFPENIPDGKWIAYFAEDTSQVALEITFVNNILWGTVVYYHSNGRIKSIQQFDTIGNTGGCDYTFFSNGVIKSMIQYNNKGIKDGLHLEFNEDGEITKKYHWRDGFILTK